MAKKAELKAKLSLNKSAFDRGIAGAMAGAKSLQKGLNTFGTVAADAFKIAGVGALLLGAALANGVKKAYDLGGGLSDMSKITGMGVKQMLLLRRYLEDAGISSEKINRYFLTGMDRGGVIAKAMSQITAKDWQDAADSVGKQADILDKNSETFDRVSDLLGRSGDKLQGFFVGVADKISSVVLPALEKFDKIDLADQGEKFGAGLIRGVDAVVGAFKDPQELAKFVEEGFDYGIKASGNVLIAVFNGGVTFFKDGMIVALAGIGQVLLATLLDAFAKPIAFFQAGLEKAMETAGDIGEEVKFGFAMANSEEGTDFDAIKAEREKARSERKKRGSMSVENRAAEILKDGVRFGFGAGQTTGEMRAGAQANISEGISKAIAAAQGISVSDVMGAGAAKSRMGMHFGNLAKTGATAISSMFPSMAPAAMQMNSSSFGRFNASAFGNRLQTSGNLGGGAYSLIRRGDHARAAEAARIKKEDERAKADPIVRAIHHPDWTKEDE